MKLKLTVDVVIVGGGIVGATTAALLAESNLRILLLEKNEPHFADNYLLEPFVSSLTPKSIEVFKKLNVWQGLPQDHQTPYTKILVWLAENKLTFTAASVGEAYLGMIINNKVLTKGLWNVLTKLKQLSILTSDSCIAMNKEGDHWELTTAAGHTITTSLVVGADGAQSWVRESAGLSMIQRSYHQSALIAVVATEKPHQFIARQRFLPTGPLAFLPLQPVDLKDKTMHYSAIVWSTEPQHGEQLLALDETAFCQACSAASEFILGKVTHCNSRHLLPLIYGQVDQYVKAGVALVGDAAHILHPMAGQGVNLGIYDALCLAKVVGEAYHKQRAFAAYHTLRAYERERKLANSCMFNTLQGFNYIFSQPLMSQLADRGMQLLDKLPCLKRQIVNYASPQV